MNALTLDVLSLTLTNFCTIWGASATKRGSHISFKSPIWNLASGGESLKKIQREENNLVPT